MRKIIVVQVILLTLTVVFGLFLKMGLLVNTDLHRLAGIASGLAGITVVIMVFMNHKSVKLKLLASAVFLFTVSAAIGGSSLKTSTNYDLSYAQMAVSGFVALILSVLLLINTKPSAKKIKK